MRGDFNPCWLVRNCNYHHPKINREMAYHPKEDYNFSSGLLELMWP